MNAKAGRRTIGSVNHYGLLFFLAIALSVLLFMASNYPLVSSTLVFFCLWQVNYYILLFCFFCLWQVNYYIFLSCFFCLWQVNYYIFLLCFFLPLARLPKEQVLIESSQSSISIEKEKKLNITFT